MDVTKSERLEKVTSWLARRLHLLIPLLVFIASTVIAGLAFVLSSALTSRAFVDERLYLFGTGAQLLMDLPAILLLFRSKWSWLGNRRERWVGFLVGFLGAVFVGVVRYVLRGHLIFMEQVPAFEQSLTLPGLWKVLMGALTVLAYGPGEALIQVYLIRAFDRAIGHERRLLSLGVVANTLLWGLGHIGAVVTYGWSAVSNALLMLTIGMVIGVMFKKTRSAVAPIVFWTLVNGTSV